MAGPIHSKNTNSFKNVVNRLEGSQLNPLFLSLLINSVEFQNKFLNIFCGWCIQSF